MRQLWLLSCLGLACSCNGPWNTQPGGTVTLPRLSVSNLVVAGRPYDTLWMSRSLPLDGSSYDSTRAFVDTSVSWVRVIRLDGPGAPDTIEYHLKAPSAVMWLPRQPEKQAILGATYRLEAHVAWNAASDWADGGVAQWQLADLSATTYTPKFFAQGPDIQAPIEALFPELALSGAAAFSGFAQDPAKSDSLARWKVTAATVDSVTQGLPVFRHLHSGDTVWYIRSSEAVKVLDGSMGVRNDRAYLVPQRVEQPGFGGLLVLQRFDSTRARILNPIAQLLMQSAGRKDVDSARQYESGQWRFGGFTSGGDGSRYGWPENFQIANLAIGYTGTTVFYAYSMDTLYAAHVRGLSNANNALPFTNIRGGFGYFSGAALDSVRLFVQSPTADTFSVQALRGPACRNAWKRSQKQGQAFDSLGTCRGVDFRAGRP